MVSERLDSGHAHLDLALARDLAVQGHVAKAESVARAYLQTKPEDPYGWHFLSRLMQSVRRAEEALHCAERAAQLAPDDPQFSLEYALLLVASGRRRDALTIGTRFEANPLPSAELNIALGTILTYCDEPLRALARFNTAAQQDPDSSDCLFNRASAQRMIGNLAGADETLQHVIRLKPWHGGAHLMRSGLRTQNESNNHISDLRQAIKHSGGDIVNLISLHFALGKELEDLARFDDAFGSFASGCHLQRRRMQYDVSSDTEVIDRIIARHTREAIGGQPGFQTDEPIFVMGLPRSGTTLVAQILGCHSAIHSIGETPALAAETISAVRRVAGRNVDKLAFVSEAFRVDAGELGKAYVEATRPQSGNTAHFVDKTPINYLYVGVIARSLPLAKIVVVARDPVDVCFSMFKTLFTGAYPYSYDLVELGHYYTAWHRLMRHWQATLGSGLLVVQYEDLISDPARVIQRVLHHCGLGWEDRCLDFNDYGDAVTTASAAQVRQRLYATSVGGAKRYGRHLESLRSTLEKSGLLGAKVAVP